EQGIVLAVVARQVQAAHFRVALGQAGHLRPAAVVTAVVDKDDLEWLSQSGQDRMEPLQERPQGGGAVVHPDDDRVGGRAHGRTSCELVAATTSGPVCMTVRVKRIDPDSIECSPRSRLSIPWWRRAARKA